MENFRYLEREILYEYDTEWENKINKLCLFVGKKRKTRKYILKLTVQHFYTVANHLRQENHSGYEVRQDGKWVTQREKE